MVPVLNQFAEQAVAHDPEEAGIAFSYAMDCINASEHPQLREVIVELAQNTESFYHNVHAVLSELHQTASRIESMTTAIHEDVHGLSDQLTIVAEKVESAAMVENRLGAVEQSLSMMLANMYVSDVPMRELQSENDAICDGSSSGISSEETLVMTVCETGIQAGGLGNLSNGMSDIAAERAWRDHNRTILSRRYRIPLSRNSRRYAKFCGFGCHRKVRRR